MINYLFPAVAIATISFVLFRRLLLRHKAQRRAVLAAMAFMLTVPAVLFSSYYVLHWPDAVWYINFRSAPGVEALSGLVGGLLGVICAAARSRPRLLSIAIMAVATVAALILLIAPFGKQLLFQRDCSKLEDTWTYGVCKQTSLSTCVPASCATVVKILGGSLTERQIAMESGTTLRGTEVWYVKRALRRHGYDLQAHVAKSLKDLPAPSILGVMVGDSGHVVVLMSKDDAGPEVGDPLAPRRRYTWQGLEERYRPKLMYFEIKRLNGGS